MGKLALPKIFIDDGNSSRKFENFQHFIFRDIDLRKKNEPISFYRGDFRGVTIKGSHFWKNDFNRADFINAYISDSTFEECCFGADFTNTIFERVKFNANNEDTCAFFNCVFIQCHFENEKIVKTTTRNCEYNQCTIKDCVFKENAFDDICFSKTAFSNLSLADMGALNLSFDECTFSNVIFDPDYLGSYLFKSSSLKGIKYEYRGHEIPLNGDIVDDYKTLSKFYFNEKRYHEALNCVILYNFNSGTQKSIIPFFESLIHVIKNDAHFIRKFEQLERCLTIIKFYSNTNIISVKDIFYLVGMLKEIDQSEFRLKDRIAYGNSLLEIENILQDIILRPWLWDSISPFEIVQADVHIEDDLLNEFKRLYKDYLNQLFIELGISNITPELKIIGVRKGSIIVEFVSYAVAVYGLAKIIKSTINEVYSMKLEFKIQNLVNKYISNGNQNALSALDKNAKIARKIILEPSNELLKKSNKLSSLFKSFYIYANTFPGSSDSSGRIKK